jgi:hypothetical protein
MLCHTPLLSRSTLTTVACTIALLGCASALPKEPVATTTTTAATTAIAKNAGGSEVTADPVTECDLVCERAQAVARAADEPDYSRQATANANAVIEGMHDDLLACYKTRVAVNPNAHASITVDIVIDPSGRVRTVETTGGAVVGNGTMSCIVQRIKRASFEPPHGGGTLRVHVPFSLRRVDSGEET